MQVRTETLRCLLEKLMKFKDFHQVTEENLIDWINDENNRVNYEGTTKEYWVALWLLHDMTKGKFYPDVKPQPKTIDIEPFNNDTGCKIQQLKKDGLDFDTIVTVYCMDNIIDAANPEKAVFVGTDNIPYTLNAWRYRNEFGEWIDPIKNGELDEVLSQVIRIGNGKHLAVDHVSV